LRPQLSFPVVVTMKTENFLSSHDTDFIQQLPENQKYQFYNSPTDNNIS